MRITRRLAILLLLIAPAAAVAAELPPALSGTVIELPETWTSLSLTFDDVPLANANGKGTKASYKGIATERWRTGETRTMSVKVKATLAADGTLILTGTAKPHGSEVKAAGGRRFLRPRGKYSFRMEDGRLVRASGKLVVEGPAGILKHHLVVPADETERIRAVGWLRSGRTGWNVNHEGYSSTSHFERVGSVCLDAGGAIYVSDDTRISRWTADGRPNGWIGGGKVGWGDHETPENDRFGWFEKPRGVFVAVDGSVYVAEAGRIDRWSVDGEPLGWLGGGTDGWQTGGGARASVEDAFVRDPRAVFVDAAGNVYAADTDNHRIAKWTSDGTYVGWIGGAVNGWQRGRAPLGYSHFRSFWQPKGLFVDGDGFIYVADTRNDRVVKRDSNGVTIGWIGGGVDGWQTGDAPNQGGNGLREFNSPHSVFVAGDGTMFVADANDRVSKWDRDGNAIGWLSVVSGGWQTGDAPDDGPNWVADVFVAPDGTIYLASSSRDRVDRFSADGTRHGAIGDGVIGWQPVVEETEDKTWSFGAGDVFAAADGYLYVVDGGNRRVIRFEKDGTPVGWIGGGQDGWRTDDPVKPVESGPRYIGENDVHAVDVDGNLYVRCEEAVCKWDAQGNLLGWIGGGVDGWQTGDPPTKGERDYRSFKGITDIAVGRDGSIYVAQSWIRRISKWAADGTAVGWVGHGLDGWQTFETPERIENPDPGLGSLYNPSGIAVDAEGNLYATDFAWDHVTKWDPSGRRIGWIGDGRTGWQTDDVPRTAAGDTNAHLNHPIGVAIAPDGMIYVADSDNRRISRWSAEGSGLDPVAPDLSDPVDVALDGNENVYVVDRHEHRIARWTTEGIPSGWIGGGRDGWQTGEAPRWAEDQRSFHHPKGVEVGPNGDLFVLDAAADRISRWTRAGTSTGWLGGGLDGWQTGEAPSPRGNYRAFDGPNSLHVDAEGNIFVLDYWNHRVSKWGRDGVAIGWIGNGRDGWEQGNSARDADGEDYRSLDQPNGLWVDGEGQIYVANYNRVLKWSADGVALGWIGSAKRGWQKTDAKGAGGEYDRFISAESVTTDAAGNIYVADPELHRVSVWSENGQPKGWIGGGKNGLSKKDAHRWHNDGRGGRSFDEPYDVWADDRGFLFVTDNENSRVSRWRIDGGAPRFSGWFGHGVDGWQFGVAPKTNGRDFRTVNYPGSIAGDRDGNIYVTNELGISWWRRASGGASK